MRVPDLSKGNRIGRSQEMAVEPGAALRRISIEE
jgi:hypothetical protein